MSNYFIYTGNAYPHKNLEKLIDAVVLGKFKLKIISARNVFTQRLEKLIIAKKAKKFVEILGFIHDKKLNNLYKNSIAFVFPTLEEGFGLPPMEAINSGTVAIVSDIPVLKEVYGNSVFYFDPNNLESIINTMNRVLNISKTERKKIIKNSQKFLSKYSWSQMAKETLKVYNSIKLN